jgi:hypothetical protein
MKKFLNLFFSIILIAGLPACDEEELGNLQSQLDEIASISTQISNIQTSISSLEKMDTELKASIEELSRKEQELGSADDARAKEIAALRETLTQMETALSKRIDDLKTYVDDELRKQSDWVTATFSTLEQYQSTCTEIANIKQSLSGQETTLKTLIADTESSIKSWVNEQLTGYYTIAQMDAKIAVLEKAVTDGDDAQAAELDKLKTALETAKTDIKTAYEQAITDAITTSEGKINEKIAADIKTATDALQSQIDEINIKITDIEARLAIIEASLEKILAQVQSIVLVPTYSDGSIEIKDYIDTEILFEVAPRSAAIALAAQSPEVFSLDAISTSAKASMFVTNFPVKSVKDNGECIALTLDATKIDIEAIDNNPLLSARLKIDDGNSSMTTNFFPLFFKENTYNISIGAETRVGIYDNHMVWNPGDNVLLSDGSTSVLRTVHDIDDNRTLASVKTHRTYAEEKYCVYPGDRVVMDGATFYVDVPEDQGTDGSAYIVSSGSSTNDYIQLSQKTALIKVTLKSDVDNLDYIKITFEGSPIVGRLKIDEQGSEVISGTQSVKVSAHGDNVFYFSVLPGSITKMDVDIYKTNGSSGRKTSSVSRTIKAGYAYNFAIDPSTLSFNAVDLGLVLSHADETEYTLYWATSNLSKDGLCPNATDFGDYYAWGETAPKESYTSDNYQASAEFMDAATVTLGGNWRMPTYTEMNELSNQCTWTWTTENEVNGYSITGPNGNSIFLPAADSKGAGNGLWYWSSSKSGSTAANALCGNGVWFAQDVWRGLPIRPVTE